MTLVQNAFQRNYYKLCSSFSFPLTISNSILLHEGVKINTSYKQLYVLQLNVQLFMYSVGSFSPLQKVHVACALPYNATDHFIFIRIDFRPTEC